LRDLLYDIKEYVSEEKKGGSLEEFDKGLIQGIDEFLAMVEELAEKYSVGLDDETIFSDRNDKDIMYKYLLRDLIFQVKEELHKMPEDNFSLSKRELGRKTAYKFYLLELIESMLMAFGLTKREAGFYDYEKHMGLEYDEEEEEE